MTKIIKLFTGEMVFALRVLIKFVVDVASNIDPIIGPLCRPLWNFIASLEVVTQL
jgi:hypothetical protein